MEPSKWAKLFHDTYETLAPNFGYITREDTREFDPHSPNGRLMIAVIEELGIAQLEAELAAETDIRNQYIKDRDRIAEGRYELERKLQQAQAEYEWMRREVERVGRALFTNSEGHYTGTEEDLHAIGACVEGVCETNERLARAAEALSAEDAIVLANIIIWEVIIDDEIVRLDEALREYARILGGEDD